VGGDRCPSGEARAAAGEPVIGEPEDATVVGARLRIRIGRGMRHWPGAQDASEPPNRTTTGHGHRKKKKKSA